MPKQYFRSGGKIGSHVTTARDVEHQYPGRITGARQSPIVRLRDVENRFYEHGANTVIVKKPGRIVPDAIDTETGGPAISSPAIPETAGRFQEQIEQFEDSHSIETVSVDRTQIPDLDVYPFDRQTIPTLATNNVAAGITNFVLCSVQIRQGIRGSLKKFGWYTTAPAAPFLLFGLYISGELYLPGGRYVGDQARTTETYDPSAGSIDYPNLAECNIHITPGATIEILVTNTDPLNGYQAWARLYGLHWADEFQTLRGMSGMSGKRSRQRRRM